MEVFLEKKNLNSCTILPSIAFLSTFQERERVHIMTKNNIISRVYELLLGTMVFVKEIDLIFFAKNKAIDFGIFMVFNLSQRSFIF